MLTSELRHSGGIVNELKRNLFCLPSPAWVPELIGSGSDRAAALLRVLLMEAVMHRAAFRQATRRSRRRTPIDAGKPCQSLLCHRPVPLL